MSYSVKKAGVAFKAKVETSADFTGQAAGFSAFYINDADGTKTDISGSFTEDANAAGLYFSPAVSIPAVGDYTIVINNATAGMDNHPTPIVVTGASIDDIKTVVDDLTSTLAVVAADVDGLNGQNLQDIKDSLAAINGLVKETSNQVITISGDESSVVSIGETVIGDTSGATGVVELVEYNSDADETRIVVKSVNGTFATGETVSDGTTSTTGTISEIVVNAVSKVIDFISDLEGAMASGSGISALEGYTDDIENMLLGTEFLADGTTANPFYDATNPGVAKESTLYTNLATLQSNIATAQTNVTNYMDTLIGASTDDETAATVFGKIAASKLIIDANKATLENAGFGLSALKDLIDGVATDVGTAETNILNVLNNATHGLEAIFNAMNARFDTVDTDLDNIEAKIDNISGAQGFNAFV